MKGTDNFKNDIKSYLDERASKDDLFARSYAKVGKSVEACVDYILDTVYKSKKNGFTDEEIYSMAVHYYDEDDTKVGAQQDLRVAVNHMVDLTEEERRDAKAKAMEDLQKEYMDGMRRKTKTKSAKNEENQPKQLTLF